MSIQTQVDRIKNNVSASYSAVQEMGGTIPTDTNSNNLPNAIKSIQGVKLVSIEVTTPPNKTTYKAGEKFDSTGMVVTGHYSVGARTLSSVLTSYTFSPSGALAEGTPLVTITYSEGGITKTCQQAIIVKPPISIYGVEWDWTSSGPTRGVRTDDAAGFPDPNPAVNNGTGSSPFDNLMPWAGMVKETRTGGVMVKEPKYWFKWTRTESGSGIKLKLQIADAPVEGFHMDPVNMDRGDGLGELDFSYIGRYHCGPDYKSTTGVTPINSISIGNANTAIHNLGANIWQFDFAQFWYVNMLFLVEYADWNGERIGRGCSATNAVTNNGQTDAMQYHTGTTATNRDAFGHVQYRNIEGYWDNLLDWVMGYYCRASTHYVIINPNDYQSLSNLVTLASFSYAAFPRDFTIPTKIGFEWALLPSRGDGSQTSYVPDLWGTFTNSRVGAFSCHGGGYYNRGQEYGPFSMTFFAASTSGGVIGCRLWERPPKTT